MRNDLLKLRICEGKMNKLVLLKFKVKTSIFEFLIILNLILNNTGLIAQEYQITNVPVVQYSIDRYNDELYYRHDITGDIYKTNSTGTHHTLTKFPSLPQFSNNSHNAAFVSGDTLYFHDFANDTSYFLEYNALLVPNLLFSPSDDKILCGGDTEVDIIYYSFKDHSVHNTGITIYPDVMDWSTDTTILYVTLGGVDIRVLNINDLNENILVQYADNVIIWGLASNININAFTYSYTFNVYENTFVNLYSLETGVDSTVYNFREQGPGQGEYEIYIIRSLAWEKGTNKLGFIGANPFQYLSLIYVFDYTSFNTYLYSDWHTNGDGFKYNLQWLNKDTVVYSDYYDGGYLFGLAVTTPVSVKDDKNFIANRFELYAAYPNPFNPSTTIKFEIPAYSSVSIKVYDIMGEEIKYLLNENLYPGQYTVEWGGSYEFDNNLSAGIYFVQMIAGKFQKTIKLIYLK
jgi:hypothetical protein